MREERDRASRLQIAPAAPHRIGVDTAPSDEHRLRLVGVFEKCRKGPTPITPRPIPDADEAAEAAFLAEFQKRRAAEIAEDRRAKAEARIAMVRGGLGSSVNGGSLLARRSPHYPSLPRAVRRQFGQPTVLADAHRLRPLASLQHPLQAREPHALPAAEMKPEQQRLANEERKRQAEEHRREKEEAFRAIDEHHRSFGAFLKVGEAYITKELHKRYHLKRSNRKVVRQLEKLIKVFQETRPVMDCERLRTQ
jgi:hypothetical protein